MERKFTPCYSKTSRFPVSMPRPTLADFGPPRFVIVINLSHRNTLLNHIISGLQHDHLIHMHGRLFHNLAPQIVAMDIKPSAWNYDLRDERGVDFLNEVLYQSHNNGSISSGFYVTPDELIDNDELFSILFKDERFLFIIISETGWKSLEDMADVEAWFDTLKNVFIAKDIIQKQLERNRSLYISFDEPTSTIIRDVIAFLGLNSTSVWNQHSIETKKEDPKQNSSFISEDAWEGFSPPKSPLWMSSDEIELSCFLRRCIIPRKQPCGLKMSSNTASAQNRWGLLVPIRSERNEYSFRGLSSMIKSIENTLIIKDEINCVTLYIGIDQDDAFLSSKTISEFLLNNFAGFKYKVVVLNEKKGHVCQIWNRLAVFAHKCGEQFLLLGGDDITFLSRNWKSNIEKKFLDVHKETGFPHGQACISFRDLSFPNFPTFPVIHASHIDLMSGKVLPAYFINQGGDPFLFEIYDRLGGTARFCNSAILNNEIGGNNQPRYTRKTIRFKADITTKCLLDIGSKMGLYSVLPSISVVVPTFRLSRTNLRAITKLRISSHIQCRVRFFIVVDNPNHPSLRKLQQELDGTSEVDGNYTVQILVHPCNLGASMARNTGIMRNQSDWIVFLDDDIIPHKDLLNSYLIATMKHPDSKILAGVTEIAEAKLMWQFCLELSGVTNFYSIAKRMVFPPWCVTANLCVRGRSNGGTFFGTEFPKSGGGEDVHFCMRMKDRNDITSCVAVPDAIVYHPWMGKNWFEAFLHVMKWVIGDSRCVEVLPEKTFLVTPGWHELLLFLGVPLLLSGLNASIPFIILMEFLFKVLTFSRSAYNMVGVVRAIPISIGAAFVLTGQELVRTVCHLRRGSWKSLCSRFDWFDGQDKQFIRTSQQELLYKFVTYISFIFFEAVVRFS